MTVIMALLLRIFTSLLRHYYALIRLLLPVIMDRYYLYNGSIIAVIMDLLLPSITRSTSYNG